MGRANNTGYTRPLCRPQHVQAFMQIPSAIIDARENMAMYIAHGRVNA